MGISTTFPSTGAFEPPDFWSINRIQGETSWNSQLRFAIESFRSMFCWPTWGRIGIVNGKLLSKTNMAMFWKFIFFMFFLMMLAISTTKNMPLVGAFFGGEILWTLQVAHALLDKDGSRAVEFWEWQKAGESDVFCTGWMGSQTGQEQGMKSYPVM